MVSRNRIWVLMGRKVSGSITLKEEQELEALLRDDPEAWYVYEILKAEWKLDDVPEEFVDKIKNLLQQDEKEEGIAGKELLLFEDEDVSSNPGKLRGVFKVVLVPLCTAAVLLFTWLGYNHLKEKAAPESFTEIYQNEITAPNGSQTQVVLSDGTKIRLNSGSKLSYSKNFNSKIEREVRLEGEAYFEIVHNENRPFIIHTPVMEIRDLGTTFNVKAYPNDAKAEATLIEGIIEVSLKSERAAKTILMQPNEKIVVYNNNNPHLDEKENDAGADETEVYRLSKVVSDPKLNELVETAWINNRLVFKNEVFKELVKDMERKYNVQITINDEELKNYKLTGVFKDESLEQALKVLQFIAPFNYSIEYDKVTIY